MQSEHILSQAPPLPPAAETASPAGARLPAPAGIHTLSRGMLVTYERDPRYAAAWTLYVVLGEPARDNKHKWRVLIQAIHRAALTVLGVTAFEAMNVLADEVTPLGAYGMRITKMVRRLDGHYSNYLFLARDPMIEATTSRQFGRQLGNGWDWCGFGAIDSDEIAGMIRDPDMPPVSSGDPDDYEDYAAGIDEDEFDAEPEELGEEEF